MSESQTEKWFVVTDGRNRANGPIDLRGTDKVSVCREAARRWYGEQAVTNADEILSHIKAAELNADGKVMTIADMFGLPARYCLPPGGVRRQSNSKKGYPEPDEE